MHVLVGGQVTTKPLESSQANAVTGFPEGKVVSALLPVGADGCCYIKNIA